MQEMQKPSYFINLYFAFFVWFLSSFIIVKTGKQLKSGILGNLILGESEDEPEISEFSSESEIQIPTTPIREFKSGFELYQFMTGEYKKYYKMLDTYDYEFKQHHDYDESNPWIILGCTTINYVEITNIWYKQLELLGYNNHFICVLDAESEAYYRRINQEKAVENLAKREYRFLKYITWDNKAAENRTNDIWRLRYDIVLERLVLGKHVFLTDVDSIWVNHRNLEQVLPASFNTFHAECRRFPPHVFEAWGFVVCGGVAGFRSDPITIDFFIKLLRLCGNKCDDQLLLNDFMMKLNVTWHREGPKLNINLLGSIENTGYYAGDVPNSAWKHEKERRIYANALRVALRQDF